MMDKKKICQKVFCNKEATHEGYYIHKGHVTGDIVWVCDEHNKEVDLSGVRKIE